MIAGIVVGAICLILYAYMQYQVKSAEQILDTYTVPGEKHKESAVPETATPVRVKKTVRAAKEKVSGGITHVEDGDVDLPDRSFLEEGAPSGD